MAHVLRLPRFRYLAMLLGGLLLLGQLAAVYHQTEHSLADPGQICLVCQAADHMQHGIAAAGLAIMPTAMPDPGVDAPAFPNPHSFHSPSARDPPSGLPA